MYNMDFSRVLSFFNTMTTLIRRDRKTNIYIVSRIQESKDPISRFYSKFLTFYCILAGQFLSTCNPFKLKFDRIVQEIDS